MAQSGSTSQNSHVSERKFASQKQQTKGSKNMKTKWIIRAGMVAVVLVGTMGVQAVPINGSIGFTGTYTQNGGSSDNLTTATSFTINTISVNTTAGVFVGAGSPTFASPIGVNPANNLIPSIQLWSVLVGSTTYRLLVTTETESLDTMAQLNLLGAGMITDGNSADNTFGVWQLGFGLSGSSFTWQSTSAAVPDGGATVTMLGLALSGVALLKKKITT
jgi:hypothetical protein